LHFSSSVAAQIVELIIRPSVAVADRRFPRQDGNMHSNISSTPNKPPTKLLDGVSVGNLSATGEVEIAGRRYVTADRLAAMLGVTVRTLGRWDAARIGPPKIKVGKLVLFDIAKVPDWLATRETGPVRAAGHRR
jgi:hypothetical protein